VRWGAPHRWPSFGTLLLAEPPEISCLTIAGGVVRREPTGQRTWQDTVDSFPWMNLPKSWPCPNPEDLFPACRCAPLMEQSGAMAAEEATRWKDGIGGPVDHVRSPTGYLLFPVAESRS
jgi:hypothetical protein